MKICRSFLRYPVCTFGVAVLASTLTTGCMIAARTLAVDGTFDRTLPVTGTVDLGVRTGSGNIHIKVGADDTVRVIGHIRAGGSFWNGLDPTEQINHLEANPPIEQRENSIQIGDITDRSLRQDVSISYELTVPANTRLRSATGSGEEFIEAIRGPLEARTGSGAIRTGHINGHVRVSTGSGAIDLGGADDGLEASTGSGSIHAEHVAGSITVRTGSGHIVVEGAPSGDWALSAGSGSVAVRVPADAGFELDADAASGSIDTSHPIELLGGNLSKHRVHGTVRGGGPRIRVSTGSGTIHIE